MSILSKIRGIITVPLLFAYAAKCALFGYDYNTGLKKTYRKPDEDKSSKTDAPKPGQS